MAREIAAHADIDGEAVLVGRLWLRTRAGRESASFEYDRSWLRHPERYSLEPSLSMGSGAFHTRRALFGAIGDSAPDRWGRVLLRRAEVRSARREGRTPRTLTESDFLLLVDDELRVGALRFRPASGGPFLAEPRRQRVPPLVELGRLLAACDRVAGRSELAEDLRLLLGPGSSLGGARPKAAIRDRDGALAIAKFPRTDDDRDIVLWEAVALTLADQAGIAVPDWRLEDVAGRRVLVSRRFDRARGRRVPYLSAMSMLGAADNEQRSYLEIADAIRTHGAAARKDLSGLWRRVVFNILVSNTDDHLRNHGFLHERGRGWRLSPAYDLNPTPTDERARVLSTQIDENDGTASLQVALETAGYHGLSVRTANRIAGEVGGAVSTWREVALHLGATRRETDRMESAFVHEDLGQAVGLG